MAVFRHSASAPPAAFAPKKGATNATFTEPPIKAIQIRNPNIEIRNNVPMHEISNWQTDVRTLFLYVSGLNH
jgi:hypothetical protein